MMLVAGYKDPGPENCHHSALQSVKGRLKTKKLIQSISLT
jgi:hypothetical protein